MGEPGAVSQRAQRALHKELGSQAGGTKGNPGQASSYLCGERRRGFVSVHPAGFALAGRQPLQRPHAGSPRRPASPSAATAAPRRCRSRGPGSQTFLTSQLPAVPALPAQCPAVLMVSASRGPRPQGLCLLARHQPTPPVAFLMSQNRLGRKLGALVRPGARQCWSRGGGSCPSTPAWCRARCFPGARAGERRCAVLPGPCSSAASLCHSRVPLGKRWGVCLQPGRAGTGTVGSWDCHSPCPARGWPSLCLPLFLLPFPNAFLSCSWCWDGRVPLLRGHAVQPPHRGPSSPLLFSPRPGKSWLRLLAAGPRGQSRLWARSLAPPAAAAHTRTKETPELYVKTTDVSAHAHRGAHGRGA